MKLRMSGWAAVCALAVFTSVFVAGCVSTRAAGQESPPPNVDSGGKEATVAATPQDVSQVDALEPSEIAGLWQGIIDAGGTQIRLVFHVELADGGFKATVDSPDQGVYGIPVQAATVTGREIVLTVPASQGVYTGTLVEDGSGIHGRWDQAGSSLPMDLSRIETVIRVTRPQDPKPPYPYDSMDVSFSSPSEGVTLAGTVTIPPGPGPFPAAVLVSGSGPQDRNEEIFNHRPFLVLSDYLTRHGIAVLRYDDRGMGGSTGNGAETTEQELAADAEAAVEYLRSIPRIDASHVGIVGHSEGGILGPIVAGFDKRLGFVVLLAGPGYGGYDILLQQSAAILRTSGASAAQIEQAQALNRSLYDIVRAEPDDDRAAARIRPILKSVGLPEDQLNAQIQGLLTPWYRSFLESDPTGPLSQTNCPVLALIGSKDVQVPADENLAAIESKVRSGGNNDVTTVKLDGLNHLFQHANTGLPAEYGQISETMAPEVMQLVGEWINAKTR